MPRDTPATRPRPPLPALDAIRILACAMVVVCHLSEYAGDGSLVGMKSGVLVFFALSGYLLYRPFVSGRPDLRGYAAARVARILPAYVVALVGVTVVTGDQTFLRQPWTYLLFLQNYDHALWQGFVGVSWTLVIEVIFYATLPAIAILVRRSPYRIALLGLLSLAGGLAVIVAGPTPADVQLASAFPFIVWAFVPGMLVATLEGSTAAARWFRRLPLLGIVLLILGIRMPVSSVDVLTASGAFLLIGWAVTVRPTFGRLAPVLAIGAAVSYSVYLWHVDLIKALEPALALVTTVLVASMVYLAVERPAIDLGGRVRRRMVADQPRPVFDPHGLDVIG